MDGSDEQYIEVTPLQPPFEVDIVTADFVNYDKKLALSCEDWDRVCMLFGGADLTGCNIEISPGEGERVRIRRVPS
jgi:hypothetical protein